MESQKRCDEIFIIDEELAQDLFNEQNYYRAELFFNYLSSWCGHSQVYMIPIIHKKIIDWIKKNSVGADTLTQTKLIAEFKIWVIEADLLGEDDGNDDKHDTELLFDLLKLIHQNKKIRVISSKYKDNPKLSSMTPDELFEHIGKDEKFMDFFERKYNIGKWDSSY